MLWGLMLYRRDKLPKLPIRVKKPKGRDYPKRL